MSRKTVLNIVLATLFGVMHARKQLRRQKKLIQCKKPWVGIAVSAPSVDVVTTLSRFIRSHGVDKAYQFESCSNLLLSPILFRLIPTVYQKNVLGWWLNDCKHPDAE